MQTLKSVTSAKRINNPSLKGLNIGQAILLLAINIALVVPTGIYLFQKSMDNQCSANNSSDAYPEKIDTSDGFAPAANAASGE